VDTLRVEDLFEKVAFAESGRRLGRIEAVGMGRDRVPRRVGVRLGEGPELRFFALAGARLDNGHVVISAELR
jgi:hypothetical protein